MNKLIFLFVVFTNVLVDIGHKIILQNIVFKTYDGSEQVIMMSIINLLILLPFILLFSPSSYISNRYNKSTIIKYGALSGLGIACLGIITYSLGYFYLSMGVLFLLAIQSAIYSPAKFAYIKDLYGQQNLSKGNGAVQGTSIIAILFGIGIFSYLFELIIHNVPKETFTNVSLLELMYPLIGLIAILALVEFLFATKLPVYKEKHTTEKFEIEEYFSLRLLRRNMKYIFDNKPILFSILGLSIFFMISQTLMVSFPAYAKETLDIENVATINIMLAFSGIGVAIGSLLYSFISKKTIELGTIYFSIISMTVCLFFITNVESNFALFATFTIFGILGGLIIVPLNSFIQYYSEEKELGTVLAGNNLFQSIFMVMGLIVTSIVALNEFESKQIIQGLTILSLGLSIFFILVNRTLFVNSVKLIILLPFKLKYDINIEGFNNIPKTGSGLILPNHVSWIDWVFILMASPRKIHFLMDKVIYNKWYLKPILSSLGAVPISSAGSKDSIKKVAEMLDNGKLICVFPEGMLTWNGNYSEFKKGVELILKQTEKETNIIPVSLDGLWETKWSRASEFYKNNDNTDKIFINIGKPILTKEISTTKIKQEISKLSLNSWNKKYTKKETVISNIITKLYKVGSRKILKDGLKDLSGRMTLSMTLAFRKIFKSKIDNTKQNTAILLPTGIGAIISNLALMMLGKTTINVNFSSERDSIQKSLDKAEVKDIITSSLFLKKLKSKGKDFDELLKNFNVIILEDEAKSIKFNVMKYLVVPYLPFSKLIVKTFYMKSGRVDDNVTLLFSSGSEGTPKGIQLTNKNILANVDQNSGLINFTKEDVIIGNLPIFHAFGYTVTTMLPLLKGVRVVLHPDPTDGFNIAKQVFSEKATIMFGTSTFLGLYNKNPKIKAEMFSSLRLIIAGAEKLSNEVREKFLNKFSKKMYEGYGATETSPVASVNIPNTVTGDFKEQLGNKLGSVGMALPGTHIIISDPADIIEYKNNIKSNPLDFTKELKQLPVGEDGMILIGGPQIMKGYYKDEDKTDESTIDINGITYYITGDKGNVDDRGFVSIIDRYSRFAKLAGEMISLTSTEEKIKEIINNTEIEVCAVNLPDPKKGEKIVLSIYIPEGINLDLKELKTELNTKLENKLMVPSEFVEMEIPKLGTGKLDFKTTKKQVSDLLDK